MREETSEREAKARQWIGSLCELPSRIAGTFFERQAAEQVANWLRELGFSEVRIVPARGGARPGRTLALHGAIGLLGLLWGGWIGVLLALLAWISFRLENRGRAVVLSRLLPAPESVNVMARRGSPQAKTRVILSAHIDTTEAGLLFSRRLTDWFGSWNHRRQGANNRLPIPPLTLPELLLASAAIITFAEWTGSHGWIFGTLRFTVLVGLALAVGLGLQWAFSQPTPGANDNASAVAAMLLSAEKLGKELGDAVELWAVGTGAEECGSGGMWDFVESHSHWDPERTFFINFECVGGGNLHYIVSEGLLGRTYYPPRLLERARAVAASGYFGQVTPVHLLAGTDGRVPAACGYPSLSLITLEDNGVPRNYHLPEDTVEHIDFAAVVRAADFGAEVAKSAVQEVLDANHKNP